jgi:hypothetical protein
MTVDENVGPDGVGVVDLLLEAFAKHLPPVGFLNGMLWTSVTVLASPGFGYSIANLEELRHSPAPI